MEKIATLLVLFGVFYYISGLSLPSGFQVCNRSHPKRNECLKSAIQSAFSLLAYGLPELKFPSLDPIKLPSLTIEAGPGTVHVEQIYENIEFHNVPLSQIEKVESTITDTEFKLVIYFKNAEMYMDFQYSFDGNVLFLPIVGKGPGKITTRDISSKLTLDGEIFEKKGKMYVKINKSVFVMNPSVVTFDLKNLFNDDPVLGPEMLAILNENWKELYKDVGHGYEAALAAVFGNYADIIMKHVAYDEVFPK